MRLVRIIFFLATFNSFAQSEIALQIESLKILEDSKDERKYELVYTIKNLTNRKLSFFFNPIGFGGSLSNKPYYKCYQNNEYLDSGQMLNNYSQKSIQVDPRILKLEGKSEKEQDSIVFSYLKENMKFEADSIKTKVTDSTIEYQGFINQNPEDRLLKQIYTIEPGAVVSHTEKLFWNKERYFTIDQHEYYVDEKGNHEFEITMVLMKEPFKDRLSKEKYQEIMDNKNFIKGVFISNKIPINFGE